MKTFFISLILLLPVLSTAQTIFNDSNQQTVYYTTNNQNDSTPGFLKLIGNGSFYCEEIPYYSCWAWGRYSGKWTIENGILRLAFDSLLMFDGDSDVYIKPETDYKIAENRLIFIGMIGDYGVIDITELSTKDDLFVFLMKRKIGPHFFKN